ncbi:MAG: carboxypeptidase-like regulatory domain-containing protein [Bacteroidota bacterium]
MKSLLFPALFLIAGALNAQTGGTLAGTVQDSIGRPVHGAMVIVSGGRRSPRRLRLSEISDAYRIDGIPAGRYVVRVKAPGMETMRRDVVIETGLETRFHATLSAPRPITPESGKGSLAGGTVRRFKPIITSTPRGDQLDKRTAARYRSIQQAIGRTKGISSEGQESHDYDFARYRYREDIKIGTVNLVRIKRPRIPKVAYARYVEGVEWDETMQSRRMRIRESGEAWRALISDPFSSFAPGGNYDLEESARWLEGTTGGFEPEYGDVVNIRPEEIGTDAITPSEYCRVTGGDPHSITDSRFTSFVQSLNDPFSTGRTVHRRGSFPRREPSAIASPAHYYHAHPVDFRRF